MAAAIATAAAVIGISCSVTTQPDASAPAELADELVTTDEGLSEVDGIDIAYVPRASAPALHPRQPVPLELPSGTALVRPGPDQVIVPEAEADPTAPLNGDSGPATEQDESGEPVSAAQAESSVADAAASATDASDTATRDTTASDATTSDPEPAGVEAPTTPAGLTVAVTEPATAIESTVEPAPAEPRAGTATVVTGSDQSVAQTTTTAPVASDGLSVGRAATTRDTDDALLSTNGALSCSAVELSIADLDRGDMAAFAAAMDTAAGFASSASESNLRDLAPTLTSGYATTAAIDTVAAFLTACASNGYEL